MIGNRFVTGRTDNLAAKRACIPGISETDILDTKVLGAELGGKVPHGRQKENGALHVACDVTRFLCDLHHQDHIASGIQTREHWRIDVKLISKEQRETLACVGMRGARAVGAVGFAAMPELVIVRAPSWHQERLPDGARRHLLPR